MNIFHKYTRQSLKFNKTRTLVTIIGIILSMALFTAVIEGAHSGIEYLKSCIVEDVGYWHGCFKDIDEKQVSALRASEEIEEVSLWGNVGWAEAGTANEYKPYLKIESLPVDGEGMAAIRIQEGSFPEGPGEILLPEHIFYNGELNCKIGDTISLEVGNREEYTGAFTLGEELSDKVNKTYKVTGTYKRLSTDIEDFSCPGYTAFTRAEKTDSYTAFFMMKDIDEFYSFTNSQKISSQWSVNSNLLHVNGIVSNGGIGRFIYGFAGVLIFLIVFGSISLIYNSFSISVSERTKMFGILKSVGATDKQIRSSVLYEALVLSAIGIPLGMIIGCTGIGVTLYSLRDAFSRLIYPDAASRIHLVLDPAALFTAALICLITTLISAWIPAKRAMTLSAMDAVRQSEDLKITEKDVKTSSLTEKLFGFPGMMGAKNFKRNKKRYRSVVISLFVSITLFISASSFTAYLKDAAGGMTENEGTADLNFYDRDHADAAAEGKSYDPERLIQLFSDADGVDDVIFAEVGQEAVGIPKDIISKDYPESADDSGSAAVLKEVPIIVAFINDSSFSDLLREQGLDPESYRDASSPRGILYNSETTSYYSSDTGNKKWRTYSLLDESSLPLEIRSLSFREMEGLVFMEQIRTEEGMKYYYYPEEYMERYWNGEIGELDEEQAVVYSADEALCDTKYRVEAVIDQELFPIGERITLLYPLSLKESVLKERSGNFAYNCSYFFKAKDHKKAYTAVKSILSEQGMDTGALVDLAEYHESEKMLMTIINVFAYGFIILISLIAAANVFNTISTNVSLRRRELAMLRSIGLSPKGFSRMMNYECLMYGLKGILWGLPASVLVTFVIWRITGNAYETGFYIPWYSVAIAVGSVFAVVFATMIYAAGKIKEEDPVEVLKNENI